MDRFAGRNFPRTDLTEYFNQTLGVEYDALGEAFEAVHRRQEDLGDVFDQLRRMKKKRPGVDDAAFERLVMHDTRSLLVVEELRAVEVSSQRANRWWWLTLDRTAHRLDESRKQPNRGLCCMSPDFFLRYLSLRPTPRDGAGLRDALPVSVEIAALELVPRELTEPALEALRAAKDDPEFVKQRKLRDLVHDARATRGEMLSGGVADLAEAIEESLLALPVPDGSIQR